MALRYWIGGSGTWSLSSTTNWSTTSGGPGGASAPTSSDYVIFDVNSGSGTVELDYTSGYLPCSGIKKTTANISFATTLNPNTSGIEVRAATGQTNANQAVECTSALKSSGSVITLLCNAAANSGSFTINLAGTNSSLYFQVNGFGTGATFTQNSAINVQGFSLSHVTYNTNSNSITTTSNNLSISGGSVGSSFNLGSSVLSAPGYTVSLNSYASASPIYFSGTVQASSLGVYASGGGSCNFAGTANLTSYAEIVGGTHSGSITLTGSSCQFYGYQSSPTINGTITMNATTNSATIGVNATSCDLRLNGTTNTISTNGNAGSGVGTLRFQNTTGSYLFADNFSAGTLLANGSSAGSMTVRSNSAGTARTLTIGSSFSLSNISWKDITGAGVIPFTGAGFVDLGGNTNIQFYIPGSGIFFGSNF